MIRIGYVAVAWKRWMVAMAGLAMLVGTVQASSLQRAGIIDARESWAGFSLRTRWGQTLDGHFPDMRGEILAVAGERRQVRVTLSTKGLKRLRPGRAVKVRVELTAPGSRKVLAKRTIRMRRAG